MSEDDRAVFAEDRIQLEHPELRRERITRGHHERRGTVDQLWEMRIADGECPRGSCSGALDESDCCSVCGWSLIAHRMRTRVAVREQPADHLTTYPGALRLDEYSPAQVEDEAA
jgi:hypothetical protein